MKFTCILHSPLDSLPVLLPSDILLHLFPFNVHEEPPEHRMLSFLSLFLFFTLHTCIYVWYFDYRDVSVDISARHFWSWKKNIFQFFSFTKMHWSVFVTEANKCTDNDNIDDLVYSLINFKVNHMEKHILNVINIIHVWTELQHI